MWKYPPSRWVLSSSYLIHNRFPALRCIHELNTSFSLSPSFCTSLLSLISILSLSLHLHFLLFSSFSVFCDCLCLPVCLSLSVCLSLYTSLSLVDRRQIDFSHIQTNRINRVDVSRKILPNIKTHTHTDKLITIVQVTTSLTGRSSWLPPTTTIRPGGEPWADEIAPLFTTYGQPARNTAPRGKMWKTFNRRCGWWQTNVAQF